MAGDEEYTCAVCKGRFVKTWTDGEAYAEMKAVFGDFSREECDIVCDDCYKKLKPYGT